MNDLDKITQTISGRKVATLFRQRSGHIEGFVESHRFPGEFVVCTWTEGGESPFAPDLDLDLSPWKEEAPINGVLVDKRLVNVLKEWDKLTRDCSGTDGYVDQGLRTAIKEYLK